MAGLVGVAAPSAAQVSANFDDFPVVRLAFEGYPDSRPKTPPALSPDLEARIVHSSIQAQLPWRKSDATVFTAGAGFDLVRFDMRQNQLPWTPEDLYDVGIALSWDQRLSEGWWLATAARPHLASDLKNWGIDHMNVDASVLLSGGHKGQARYGFGAIMTSIFGERLVLPLLDVAWARRDNILGVRALLPEHAVIMYRPTKSIGLGLRGRVDGNQYRIGESVEFPSGTPQQDVVVHYSTFTVGMMVETKLAADTYLEFEGGTALFRRFDIEAGNGNVADLDLSDDLVLKAALEFRI